MNVLVMQEELTIQVQRTPNEPLSNTGDTLSAGVFGLKMKEFVENILLTNICNNKMSLTDLFSK